MRPKTVVLTLVVAVGLVALAAIMKSVANRGPAAIAPETTVEPAKQASAPSTETAKHVSTNNSAVTEEIRQAEIEKQLDEIRGLIVGGQGNPAATAALCEKVTNPESAVRKAALEGVIALNDSGAVPRLEEAVQALENPREKVAVMDAIAYLQLTNTMPDVPPTNFTSAADSSQTPPPRRSSNDPNKKKRTSGTRQARMLQRNMQQQQGQAPAPPQGIGQPPAGYDPSSAPNPNSAPAPDPGQQGQPTAPPQQ